jgi:hypothetical protein
MKTCPTSSNDETLPVMTARPFVGSVMRDRIFRSVLLPAPFLPMIPSTSPCFTSNEIFRVPRILRGFLLGRKIFLEAVGHCLAKAAAGPVPDVVHLRQIFRCYDNRAVHIEFKLLENGKIFRSFFHAK